MMNPGAIPAVLSIFGAIAGINAGKEMEELSKRQSVMAEENALLSQRELDEQVRRQEEEDLRLRSSALAIAAGSGATISGSPASHLAYLETEQERALDWTKTAGASRIRLDLQAAQLEADALQTAGETKQFESFFGGITSSFMFMEQGGMFS